MTISSGTYWQSGIYRQPKVNNPPNGQRGNNARHAIWHFSQPIVIHRFLGGWVDGRYERGEATLTTVQATVTDNKTNALKQEKEGERVESGIVVHIDSMQPENIGLNCIIVNDEHHTNLIEYSSRLWRPVEVVELDMATDEEHGGKVLRVSCVMHKETTQELKRGKADEVIKSW